MTPRPFDLMGSFYSYTTIRLYLAITLLILKYLFYQYNSESIILLSGRFVSSLIFLVQQVY